MVMVYVGTPTYIRYIIGANFTLTVLRRIHSIKFFFRYAVSTESMPNRIALSVTVIAQGGDFASAFTCMFFAPQSFCAATFRAFLPFDDFSFY